MKKDFKFKIVVLLVAAALLCTSTACKNKHEDKVPDQYIPEDFRYMPTTENAALETAEFSVWSSYVTDKIKRDDDRETKFREVYIEGAGGETESGQLIMTAKRDVENYTLEISDLKCGNNVISAEDDIEVFVQKYIKIVEQSHKDSPYGKGWYPDALVPYHSIAECGENKVELCEEQSQNQGFWFDVVIPENTPSGLYEGKITLKADDDVFEIPMKVRVFGFSIGKTIHSKTAFGIWRWMISAEYGEDYDADEVYEAYYEFLLKYKINGDWLPGSRERAAYAPDREQEKVFVSPAEFAAIAYKYAKRDEVNSFEIPWNYEVALARNYLYELAKVVIDESKKDVEFNIFSKAFLYTYDEPPKDELENVIKMSGDIRKMKRELAETLKKEFSDIKGIDGLIESLLDMNVIVTINNPSFLYDNIGKVEDGIETWCPAYDAVGGGDDNGRFYYEYYKAMERGEHIWWYELCAYPYINYNIDTISSYARILNWQMKDYDIEGNLYWCTNVFMKWKGDKIGYVDRDVWNDADSFPGSNNETINGAGYILYPGNRYGLGNDPIPTIRLASIRDGQEDYEYLWKLEQLINEANEIFGSAITMEEVMGDLYATLYKGVKPYPEMDSVFKARREVASMIEALSGKLKAAATVMRDGETDGLTKVNIYAPKDSTVKVNGVAANYRNGTYTASLKLDKKDDNILEIIVENGEDTTKFYRTAPCGGKIIDDLEENRWSQDEISVGSISALDGYGTVFVAEHGDKKTINSSLRLKDGNLKDFEAVEFYAYNPDDSVIQVDFTLYETGGKDSCHSMAVLRPKRWTKVRIAIPPKGVFDSANVEELKVTFENPAEDESVSVIIDNIIGVKK